MLSCTVASNKMLCQYVLTVSDQDVSKFVDHITPVIKDVCYKLSGRLLSEEDKSKLDKMKEKSDNEACNRFFLLWLQQNKSASWYLLISTLREPEVNRSNVADEIKQLLQPLEGNIYLYRVTHHQHYSTKDPRKTKPVNTGSQNQTS